MTDPRLDRELALARERARRSLPGQLLVLLGLIAMYLPLPKRFVAVLPLVIGVVLTVRLLRYLAGRELRERVWPLLTLLIAGLVLLNLALQAAFYPRVSAYERCLAGAQTSLARADCERIRDEGPFGSDYLPQ